MEQKRNAFLVSASMRKYLVAAILSMLIQNLNTIIDGNLMGQFLGSSAFSAVNLCLPAVGIVVTLGMLFFSGGAVLCSMAMGARDTQRANRIYTICLASVTVLSVLILVLSLAGLGGITSVISSEPALQGYVRDYLFVYFIGCPVILIATALLSFTDVGGKPSLVTLASACNIVTNLLCDVIYVGILKMGIGGAALATITGGASTIILVVGDTLLHGGTFHFAKPEGEFKELFPEILRYGVPMMFQSVTIVAYAFVCNIIGQKYCGVNGAFVCSLLSQATALCQGVSGGVGKTFSAIGGMLIGQKDNSGVNMLYRKGMTISLVFSVIFTVLLMVLAAPFSRLMGAETPELVGYAARSLCMALPFVIPISIVWVIPNVYAIIGELSFLLPVSISQPVFTGVSLVCCAVLFGNDRMWLGYPVAAVLCLALLIILSEAARRKSDVSKHFLSLLPADEKKKNVCDISVECDGEAMIETLKGLNDFFAGQDMEYMQGLRVRLCIEEVMLNIIEHAGRNKSHFFDLKIVVDDERVEAIIKDDGTPFDPLSAEEKGFGLKLLDGMCQDIDYNYSYGQNMLFLGWKKEV